MRSISFVFILVVVAVAVNADPPPSKLKPHYDIEKAPELFEKYIKDFKKVYKNEADKHEHYLAFVESLKTINKFNTESSSATFDINYLADYTEEEKKNLYGLKTEPSPVQIITSTPKV